MLFAVYDKRWGRREFLIFRGMEVISIIRSGVDYRTILLM